MKTRLKWIVLALLVVGGILQNQDGVVSIKADRFAPLREIGAAAPSHDFH